MSNTTYFDQIVKEIGFDPKKDTGLFNPMPDENNTKIFKPLLESDSHGNVVYNLMNIHGQIIADDVSEAKSKQKYKPVQIIRKADPGDGPKYLPVRTGQGVFPWISKEIVELFVNKRKVKRLILTEGYKKAFVACKKGIACIGLPGITVWKSKESKEIFNDVRLFVEACQVEDILWLTDADTLQVHWEPNKDLYKRPNSFYTSVTLFKSLCRDWNVNLFYAHIHEDSKDKGLDDLLINHPDKEKQIVKELLRTSGDSFYFSRYNISTMSYLKIQEIFGIHSDATAFYDKYEQFIGLQEFIYRNGIYAFDIEKNEVKYLKCGESGQFVRIMKDYYMKASAPTPTAFIKNTLIPTDKDSIRENFKKDYKKEKVNQIIYDIPFYHGFYNEPSHTNFKPFIPVISEDGYTTLWFNRYMPLTHRPLKKEVNLEDIPLTFGFMKHIFGEGDIIYKGKVIKEYDLGFDYLQNLYLRPKQMLPILSLVSRQNDTGKTVFWRWLVAIFQQNARIIPPEMLTGNFTEYFMNCLLVVIDEALFNKRETMERVKSMTTNDTSMVNGKHVKEMEVQTYMKIGLSSNNVDDFAILTAEDKRFWVREVPVIPEQKRITDFYDKLCDEIPDFLTYLSNRSFATDNDDRLYFAPWVRHTEALARVIKGSRPGKEKLIVDAIKNYIVDSGKLLVHLSKGDIRELTGERGLELTTIGWVLETKMQKKMLGYSKAYIYYDFRLAENDMSSDSVVEQRRKTNYYTFEAREFFNNDEIIEIYSLDQLIEAENLGHIDSTFKASITATEYYQSFAKRKKAPPCELEDFVEVYNSSSSFKELESNLQKFIVNGRSEEDLPF